MNIPATFWEIRRLFEAGDYVGVDVRRREAQARGKILGIGMSNDNWRRQFKLEHVEVRFDYWRHSA